MVQIANNPLFIEDLSASNNEVKRGSTATRRITVKNLGDKRAEIDIWIAATDEKSEPLLRWCTFSEQNPLNLEPKDSREVTLNFEVPPQAPPDLYSYEILIEAPAQYPDKIIRRPQQLRVLLSEQDGEWGSEPGFTLQPVTTSAKPYRLKAGEQLEVKVKVENRSKRVDRFYLTCPDLNQEWFTIRYPESSLQMSGFVKETDGLELNPGGTGEITLQLHPSRHTLTGNYFPTIRLISTNKEDLVLLDVVYLQILPDDSLNVELHPVVRKVPREAGEFEVEVSNQGNINRELTILAADEEGIFTYTPAPPLVRLSPGDTSTVALKVKPRRWWRRPFRGTALEIDFDVELENANELLLIPETSKPPALPKDLPRGTVVWESRPLWLLWLLIALALGTIGAIALYLWWLFFKPLPFPPSPKVLQFDNTTVEVDGKQEKKEYQEGYGDAIRLDWKISNLSQIEKVTVIRLEQNVETDRKSYFFNEKNVKIPSHLLPVKNQINNYCLEETQDKNSDILICKGIITNAKKAGNYTFKILVFPQPNQKDPSDTRISDTITIKPVTPLPLPKVIDFSSTKPSYEEASLLQLPISSSLTQLPEPDSLSSRPTPAPILLNWEISNPNNVKELRIVGLAPDGSINSELKRYEIKNNILPPELRIYCEPKENLSEKKNLVCRNVPTDARKPGDYIFKLMVISPGQQEPTESKQTATIKIQPLPLPKVTDFSSSEPVYQEISAQTLQASGQNGLIRLNWEIANASQIKELKVVGLAPDGSINSQSKQYIFINNTLPPELKNFCSLTTKLICRGVPTDARKAGEYTFKLTVTGQGQQEPTEAKQTANIKILPLPLPKITDFASTQPAYEEVSAGTPQLPNGKNISSNTTQTTAPGSSSRPPAGPIRLNWEIDNARQIKELKVVGLAPDGSINSKLKRYAVNNNSLPPELKGFCVLATKLICQNVPTDAGQAGDYTFKLTVVPKQEQEAPEIAKNTATIKIKPVPPKPPTPPTPVNIISFKINNEEVSQKPKYTYAINKDRSSVDIVLSWQVQNGEDIKVELLPSPGAVSPQGSINYTLSKPPSNATITLKVTNKAGEQKTQSVVIETVEPNKSSQPQKSPPGGASSGAPSPAGASPGTPSPGGASPTPSNPARLSPIELPPRPD